MPNRNPGWGRNTLFPDNHSPCKDCPDRHVGCHSECPRYQAFAQEREAYREEHRKKVEAEATTWEGLKRAQTKALRKRGTLNNKKAARER